VIGRQATEVLPEVFGPEQPTTGNKIPTTTAFARSIRLPTFGGPRNE